MALTPRKRAFAMALARGASNRDAAIEAGYSAATAPQAGSRLAKDKDVVAELGRIGIAMPVKSRAGRKPKAVASGNAAPPPKGFTGPNGVKAPDAPDGWPFGMAPPVDATTPAPPEPPEPFQFADPLDYIKRVVNDKGADPKERLDAAKFWSRLVHAPKAPVGKKAGKEEAAAAAMGGAGAGAPNPFAPRRGLKAVK